MTGGLKQDASRNIAGQVIKNTTNNWRLLLQWRKASCKVYLSQ